MIRSESTCCLAANVCLILCGPAGAELVDSRNKVVDAFRVDMAPVIDGSLDDDAWAFGTVVEDFHQVDPDEYSQPSEKSRIYIVYTKDALYIAGQFWDREPDKISAQVLRQGDFSFGDDTVTVMIDPFNSGRNGYAFDLSANGVRNQALFANVTNENWNWRGIWHGATRRTEYGWTAEIEIPFKTLSFDPKNDTWGLNFARYIGRRSEYIGWVSSNHTQNPATFGEMTDMHGMDQGVGLDVVPGIRIGRSTDYETDASSTETEPTVDLFYKLTPGVTAALTVNTDFSGTGVDERQINLTRFGLFFPERRSFFLQDTDIFEFGRIGAGDYKSKSSLSGVEKESGRPFFSRRIGLSDAGETVDIIAGGKLTGRVGGWDLGMLAIQQDSIDGADTSELFVARVAANIFAESSVGMILTHGDPNSNRNNMLAGVDFRYLNTRLPGGRTLEGGFWYQQTETDGLDGDDAAYGFSLASPNASGLRGTLAYKELQRNYNPALGFANRLDVRDLSAEIGYIAFPDSTLLRSTYTGVDFQRIETLAGELQTQVLTLRPIELANDRSDKLAFRYDLLEEQLDEPFEISDGIIIPADLYSFEQYCVSLTTGESRKLRAELYYCGGDFYDGSQDAIGSELIWRPNRHFRFSARTDYNDIDLPGGSFVTRLASVRADIAFTNTWYWENFVQYDNVSYSLGVNSILRWVPRAGREMVLVLNRELVDYLRNRSFTTVSGDVTFKFSYTFRF
ncbi:MAG: carbohydrate binding family 9 domain-containing protein [Gammaproteobacteria bacterium]|nr:carbohydrate binding family 9 domain-containing protein [Gammaproteobacteria bacterium]MDH5311481.1 carbohydrate binding family 9 domain-containing protein [Gammaproteobacteria bacterium]